MEPVGPLEVGEHEDVEQLGGELPFRPGSTSTPV
jgi:hypothetical protein